MKWSQIRLGTVCEIASGYPFKSAGFTDNPQDVALVKGENLGQGEVLWDISKRWPKSDLDGIARYRLEPDDVLLAMDRPWVPAGLKFAKIRSHHPEAYLVQRVARLRAANNLTQGFLSCIVGSQAFSEYIKNIGRGVGVPHISANEIGEYSFLLPPLPTQRRIAEILSAYDDLIENNQRRMKLLEESARLLYEEWFVRLRFPGHEHTKIVDGLPEGWSQGQIRDIGQVITGKTPDTKNISNFGDYMPFIKTPDMHGLAIIISTETCLSLRGVESQSKKVVPRGSILVSCIGTLGVVALTAIESSFNQQINAIIPKVEYLQYYAYFACKKLRPKLAALGGGATMPNVNKEKFESIDFAIPKKEILIRFQEISASIFNEIEILLQQSMKLRAARDLLLPRLMNGEIEV